MEWIKMFMRNRKNHWNVWGIGEKFTFIKGKEKETVYVKKEIQTINDFIDRLEQEKNLQKWRKELKENPTFYYNGKRQEYRMAIVFDIKKQEDKYVSTLMYENIEFLCYVYKWEGNWKWKVTVRENWKWEYLDLQQQHLGVNELPFSNHRKEKVKKGLVRLMSELKMHPLYRLHLLHTVTDQSKHLWNVKG
jgi:hypothetical protein